MIKIAPSILSADFSKLGEEVERLERGGADYIHIDVMDGHFVPNLTIGPLVVKSIRSRATVPFDVHLMMDNPMDFVEDFVKAGADSITLHAEVLPHLHRSIQYVKQMGVKVAVALNPSTSLHAMDYVLEEVDMVLLMTVNPGFGGQAFIPSMMGKVAELRNRIDKLGLNTELQVDGGVSVDNIREIANAGANVFVAGSAIFKAPDPEAAIKLMREAAQP